MKSKTITRGLTIFGHLFLVLALLAFLFGIGMAVFYEIPEAQSNEMKTAANRLAKFAYFATGFGYGLFLLFMSFVSLALAAVTQSSMER